MKFLKTCCAFSKSQLEHYCEQHGDRCPDVGLTYQKKYKDEWIDMDAKFVLLAENATYIATFCPFCGKNLFENCVPEETNE